MKPTIEITEERIAALLDGRLNAEEREQLLAQVAASEEWREILGDAARVLHDEEEQERLMKVSSVRPLQTHRLYRALLPIAAALIVVAGAAAWWQRAHSAPSDDIDRMVATLTPREGGLPVGWNERPWPTARGPGDGLTERGRAVRVGGTLADLYLATARRDTAATPIVIRQLTLLLTDLPGSAAVRSVLLSASDSATTPGAPSIAPSVVREITPSIAKLVGEELAYLGAWLETTRIATLERDQRFFARDAKAELAAVKAAAGDDATMQAEIRELGASMSSDGPREWSQMRATVDRVIAGLAR